MTKAEVVLRIASAAFIGLLVFWCVAQLTAHSSSDLHRISGTITHDDGSPFPDVTLRFIGSLPSGQRYNLITGTDGKGYYEGLVPTGWSGTVTPSYDDLPLRPAEFVQR